MTYLDRNVRLNYYKMTNKAIINKDKIVIDKNSSMENEIVTHYPIRFTILSQEPFLIKGNVPIYRYCVFVNNTFVMYLMNEKSEFSPAADIYNTVKFAGTHFKFNGLLNTIRHIINNGFLGIAINTFDKWAKPKLRKIIMCRIKAMIEKENQEEEYHKRYRKKIYRKSIKHMIMSEYNILKKHIIDYIKHSDIIEVKRLFIDKVMAYFTKNHKIDNRIMMIVDDLINEKRSLINVAISLTQYFLPIQMWKVREGWLNAGFEIKNLYCDPDIDISQSTVKYHIDANKIQINLIKDNMKKIFMSHVCFHINRSVLTIHKELKNLICNRYAGIDFSCSAVVFTLNV